jgi:hypothetical protein
MTIGFFSWLIFTGGRGFYGYLLPVKNGHKMVIKCNISVKLRKTGFLRPYDHMTITACARTRAVLKYAGHA